MSLDLLDSLDRRLNALGEKVARLEATTRKVVISRDARAGAQEIAANFAAQQERAEKSLLSLATGLCPSPPTTHGQRQ